MRTWALSAGLGIVLVAAGDVWSALSARNWTFELNEGETIHLPQVEADLTIREATVEFHEGTNRASRYAAALEFSGAEPTKLEASVNNPVRFRGHSFYLSGIYGQSGRATVTLIARRNPAWVFLLIAFAILNFGVLGFAVALVLRGRGQDEPVTELEQWLRYGALALLFGGTALLVQRTFVAGHLPFANMYEALLFFGTATLVFLAFTRDTSIAGLAIALALGATLFLLPARLSAPKPLMPALQSPWFGPHVALAFLGYGGLLAAVLSPRRGAALPIAFACFTVAMTLGAVWAEAAWARFWSWDPKETWSLVTWLLMAGALVMRPFGHKRIERILAAIALATVLYNFVIVNVVLRGLHSYK